MKIARKSCREFLMCVSLLAVSGSIMSQNLPPEVIAYPQIVLHGGKILTADPQFTIVQAVAIRDGKFLATGTDERILAMVGPKTRKVDLRGRSVVPGFIDTHLHTAFIGNNGFGALETGERDRADWSTAETALAWIKRQVDKRKPGEIVSLEGPSTKVFVNDLNAEVLDKVSPNNPLFLEAGNDQVVANSLLLKMIPLNVPGVLKDKNGKPTGQLRGSIAGVPVWDLEPWPPVESLLEPQKKYFRSTSEQGLTTIMGRAKGLAISVFRDLWLKKELNVRVRVISELVRQNPFPEPYLKRVGNLTDFGNDMLKIIGTTVQAVDGSTGTGSAFTSFTKIGPSEQDPYELFGQNKWSEVGDSDFTEKRNIILANRYGWTILGMHSSGDMSTATILEAYEEANKERSIKNRHFGIDHIEMLRSEDIPRFKALGVIPSVYSKALDKNDNLVKMYGIDRVSTFQPVKSIIEGGVFPAAESDSQLAGSAPLYNIRLWVTRKDQKARTIGPKEKASREEALRMYTIWAARYSGEQDIIGSIEPGKLADLVVLSGDYMTFPEQDLDKLRVLMTTVGGNVVFEAPGAF